jgi:formylmethanofuran dehydrogenase subunit E
MDRLLYKSQQAACRSEKRSAIMANENPRAAIERLISEGDLKGLIDRAAEVHGHYCPGLALGVKASYIACKRLGIVRSEGMERIMTIAECNNCFVDGVQVISGCTLGNNALIYKDLGKTAVTFYRRGEETGLRLVAKSFSTGEDDPAERETEALFDRAVKKREKLNPEESKRFKELWKRRAYRILEHPEDEIFKVETVDAAQIEYAPIFNSVNCSICGEKVMETRIRMKNGEPVCITCAGDDYRMVAGKGIRSISP